MRHRLIQNLQSKLRQNKILTAADGRLHRLSESYELGFTVNPYTTSSLRHTDNRLKGCHDHLARLCQAVYKPYTVSDSATHEGSNQKR